jgi:predicted metal-dependent enzyme (double-stranded beta helix superfamily)
MITRVPRRQLIEFTRFFAAEVSAGRYPYVRYHEDERWHQRVYRDPRIDIWLISWLPSQGTELHDHGGSSGAFTVLRGTLTEAVPSQAGIRDTERPTGISVGFGPHYIHDVRNLGAAAAVSVHAYSPPLTTMNYYDLQDTRIVRMRSIATDDPEPVAMPSAS